MSHGLPSVGSFVVRGLTLHRPWQVPMSTGVKPVENRKWTPPRWMLGKFIALHAGVAVDLDGIEWMEETFPGLVLPADHGAPSVIVAVVRLVAVLRANHTGDPSVIQGKVPSWFTLEDRRWFFGPYGWIVEAPEGGRAQPLPTPVVARGLQKLWNLPPSVHALVRPQVKGNTP